MEVLVLGGGKMGLEVAGDLYSEGYDVTVADIRPMSFTYQSIIGVNWVQADLSDRATIKALMKDFDTIVGALPASIGFGAVEVAVDLGKKYIDLSYCPQDITTLHQKALDTGALVVPDVGIAPGVSNLIAGRALHSGRKSVIIYVGGFAEDPNAPMGYAVSWSTEDLMDEYVRPARIIINGEEKVEEALTGIETINMPGVGNLEAFYTDGLRTLLEYKKGENITLIEKTMRRAGHMDQLKSLVKQNQLVDFVNKNCVGLKDMLVMRVDADGERIGLVVHGDPTLSAMARTTAWSCSVFARAVLEGRVKGTGVMPPEKLAEDDELYKYIMDGLKNNGLMFSHQYPYL